DVILDFRGERIRDDKDLMRRCGSAPVGTVAPLKVFRDGHEQMLSIIVGRRPGNELIESQAGANKAEAPRMQSIGITIAELTGQLGIGKTVSNVRGAYVANVTPGSVAEDAGLKNGDVIELFNRETINTKADYTRVLTRLKPG